MTYDEEGARRMAIVDLGGECGLTYPRLRGRRHPAKR